MCIRDSRKEILAQVSGQKLWMDAYTAALFEGENASIEVAEDFLQKAGPKEYALLEAVYKRQSRKRSDYR